jgi:hypothetical protein
MGFLPTVVAGSPITLTIPFVDANGAPFTGASIAAGGLSLDVVAHDNTVVGTIAFASLSQPVDAATLMSVTIPGADNRLPAAWPNDQAVMSVYPGPQNVWNAFGQVSGQGAQQPTPPTSPPTWNWQTQQSSDTSGLQWIFPTEAIREARLNLTLKDGSAICVKAQYRIIAADERLVLLQNSFQSYNEALLTANAMPNLSTFPSAVDNDRIMALEEAWLRLTRLGYLVRWPRDPDAQNYLNWYDRRNEVIIPRIWAVMTLERWFTFYPEVFRAAMRRAQVSEADAVLANSVYEQRRAAGIIEEKIGPAGVKYRPTKSIAQSLGISSRTLDYLTGFVNIRHAIGRV